MAVLVLVFLIANERRRLHLDPHLAADRGAAIVIWLLPLSRYATGALAVLVSLARGRDLDRAGGALRLLAAGPAVRRSRRRGSATSTSRTTSASTASRSGSSASPSSRWRRAIGYGFWVGRDRPRAYFGLMLFLTGATVGVFVAQDLLLFYAFFEAMLIPLYILIGVWGGARPARRDDQVRHLHDGRLAPDARRDHRLRAARPGRSTSSTGRRARAAGSSSASWSRSSIKAPLFPFHGWLPDAYREAPPEVTAVLSGVIAKAGLYGMLRIAITKFPDPTSYYRTTMLVLAAGGARLRLAARVPLARLPRRRRVLVARAVGADRARPLLGHEPRLRRRGAADGRARPRLDRRSS